MSVFSILGRPCLKPSNVRTKFPPWLHIPQACGFTYVKPLDMGVGESARNSKGNVCVRVSYIVSLLFLLQSNHFKNLFDVRALAGWLTSRLAGKTFLSCPGTRWLDGFLPSWLAPAGCLALWLAGVLAGWLPGRGVG